MKQILLLIFLGIFLGQVGYCEERVSEPTFTNTTEISQEEQPSINEIPIEEVSEQNINEIEPNQPQPEETNTEENPENASSAKNLSEDELTQETKTQSKKVGEYSIEDIPEIYRNLEVPTHKYIHDLDPEEFVDTQNAAWSPYSLFRLTAPLYFKTIAIKPGYYLLTPREHAGNWYMLFKESGKVKYIIPVIETDIVLEDSYKNKIPEKKLTKSQKAKKKITHFFDNLFENTKKIDPPTSFIQAQQLDNNFMEIIYYFGNNKYTMYFRTTSF